MAAISGHSFNIGPYGKNNEKSSCLKQLDQWGQDLTLVEWSLDGPLSELYPLDP